MPWINGVEVPDHELPGSWSGAFAYESFMESLNWRKREAWEKSAALVAQPDYESPALEKDAFGCLWPVMGTACPHWEQPYSTLPAVRCERQAGRGTAHEGVGLCSLHGGHYGRGKNEGAVLMAMLFADEMNVTPWEALLSQVRLLANQVRWLRVRVENAEREFGVDAIKPGGEGWDWVCLLESRGDRLAKVSKMAIDAGVAERLVRQVELEADHMVTAALETLELAGVTGKARDAALEFMGRRLIELEQGENMAFALKELA